MDLAKNKREKRPSVSPVRIPTRISALNPHRKVFYSPSRKSYPSPGDHQDYGHQ